MSHGQYTAVVILIVAIQFAIYFVTGPAIAYAIGAATLNNEIGYDTVKREAIVKTLTCQFSEISYRVGRVGIKKFHLHIALCCFDNCLRHSFC